MWQYILNHLVEAVLLGLLSIAFSYILYRSPRIRSILKPGEIEKTLTADKEALRKECDSLRTENIRLKHGNEYLLDELSIARTVRSNQRDKLDQALAEVERTNAQIDKIRRNLNRDL